MNLKPIYGMLDFELKTAAERTQLVQHIIADHPELSSYISKMNVNVATTKKLSEHNPVCKAIEFLGNYILFAEDLKLLNKKTIKLSTRQNNLRAPKETSLDELLEKAPDVQVDNFDFSRNSYKKSKLTITSDDLLNYEALGQRAEGIQNLQNILDYSTGKKEVPADFNRELLSPIAAYRMKFVIIEMRQEQYHILDQLRKPIDIPGAEHNCPPVYDLFVDTGYAIPDMRLKDGMAAQAWEWREISCNSIDLTDPLHVYAILENYGYLYEHCYTDFYSDLRALLFTIDDIIEDTHLELDRKHILIRKIDKARNETIAKELEKLYGVKYNDNYISTIWKHEICEDIAQSAKYSLDKWLNRNNPLKWKRCSTCKKLKLKTNEFFVKKNTAKDGLSSRCKECDKEARRLKKISKN